MDILGNPTGGGIRYDSQGFGSWLASRGTKVHEGIDLLLPGGPGQLVTSPIGAKFERIAYPYSDSRKIRGVELRGDVWIKMFYIEPFEDLVGTYVIKGQPIGTAQDVGKDYYGNLKITPHVHLQVEKINPLILLGD